MFTHHWRNFLRYVFLRCVMRVHCAVCCVTCAWWKLGFTVIVNTILSMVNTVFFCIYGERIIYVFIIANGSVMLVFRIFCRMQFLTTMFCLWKTHSIFIQYCYCFKRKNQRLIPCSFEINTTGICLNLFFIRGSSRPLSRAAATFSAGCSKIRLASRRAVENLAGGGANIFRRRGSSRRHSVNS